MAIIYQPGIFREEFNSAGYHFEDIGWFDANQAAKTGTTLQLTELSTTVGQRSNAQWLGFFKPETTETYTIETVSDDGSYVWLGENAYDPTIANVTLNNGGLHSPTSRTATIDLVAGTYYPIRLQYGNNVGPSNFTFFITTPTIPRTSNMEGLIFHDPEADRGFRHPEDIPPPPPPPITPPPAVPPAVKAGPLPVDTDLYSLGVQSKQFSDIISRQIDMDYVPPQNFYLIFEKLPQVVFLAQQIQIPSVSGGETQLSNALNNTFIPGDSLDYSQLDVNFLLDKHFVTYRSILQWLKGINNPDDLSQYTYWTQKTNTAQGSLSGNGFANTMSNFQVIGCDPANEPLIQWTFYNGFPVSLDGPAWDATTPDVDYLQSNVSLRFTHFHTQTYVNGVLQNDKI